MKKILLCFIVFLNITFVFSQNNSFWKKEALITSSKVKTNKQDIKDPKIYSLDIDNLKLALQTAPNRSEISKKSNIIIPFPNSKGEFENFRIKEASIMHPDLQARYPDIRSYVGQGVEDPSKTIRFSVSPLGLISMSLSANDSSTFIEPYSNDLKYYVVLKKSDASNKNDGFECEVMDSFNKTLNTGKSASVLKNADDGTLRTYRLAMSATGEYTQYHGGTKALALAAINSTMTIVNGVFEIDFNVTMQLIANTDAVIYTSTTTDPYGNTTSGYNSALQSTLTNVIGEANYDIGHLVANLQNNGNAGCIGCVCVNNQKGSGWTSYSTPDNFNFAIDYVAHEMGHQFGANHTWTHGGNEGSGAQMEPGSGSTIMGYAGITGATDVQAHSDPYFHAISIQQITNYVKSTSCQTNIVTGNAVPTASAGADFTIPKGTPFVLTGSGTDANSGDVLTYCWEQMNNGSSSTTNPSPTATSGPAFRSFNPTTDTKRYFPRLETIKTGSTSWQWEAIPNVARTLNFRLTVRDNVAGGGNNNSDDAIISVNGTAGPFIVNSPNTSVIWNAGTTQTVTWNVAGTTANGVNAANVDIYLSTDGGDTYPITLATGVANDGSQDITVPNNQGTQNRIMVKGSNHIFFDISNANFTIAQPVVCNATTPTGFAASDFGSTSATLSWNAVPGATYDLEYRQVGIGTWTTIGVSGVSQILSGLSLSTQYEAQVRSKCSDLSTSAFSSIINFSTLANLGCTGGIASYPYTESFENTLGAWTQSSNDDMDWTVDASGTPSASTGPTSASNGTYYIYVEASSPNYPSKRAIINSPCFDLSGLSQATFSFNYHMYGAADMGTIELEASANNGITWSSVWNQTGNQGNSWFAVNVDLAAYVGGSVQLRFNRFVGSTWQADVAIDNVSLTGVEGQDTTAPTITLVGASTINLTVGDTYTEQGATATDNIDGNISANIIIGGDSVNTNTPATYMVTYNVSDAAGNVATEVTRTVIVAPDTTAPVITLVGASTVNLNVGGTYTEQGATALDNVDGNLTSNIAIGGDTVDTINAGTYLVTYNVSDAAGNAAIAVVRTIIVEVDATAPVITLNGSLSINLNVGDTYNEIGATATDNIDGDISANILIGGDTVNTNTPATYIVTYNVSDTAGNSAAQVIRTIIVNPDTTAPVISLIGASTIDITVSGTYNEQGATANDNIDGNISANIIISGVVNTNTVGTYFVTYNVSDAAGNAAAQVIRTVNVNPAITNVVLNQGYFETGWDNWIDGGSDCARYSGTRSFEGNFSIYIRDNSGTASAMTSPVFNLTTFNQVEVNFYFYANSMENGEDFWLLYYNGSTWTTIATYARGTDFNNNTFYTATVTINSAQYNFATNSQFRFQCDASGNNDLVYIDQVTITGISGASRGNNDNLIALGSGSTDREASDNSIDFEENFRVYPNPVKGDILNVAISGVEKFSYRIMNMIGQTIIKGDSNGEVRVGNLETGMYFIEVNDGDEIMTKKFIKK